MRTEKEKMLAGELYNATDRELSEERVRAGTLVKQFNETAPTDLSLRNFILTELLGKPGKNLIIEPPFFCDYGYNISVGANVFFNFNCVILDVLPVEIGDSTLFGPNVQIYTASHPMNWQERASGLEFGKPVKIGTHVWVGGSVVICPGVTIGDRSVIGAGSVVTKDIPDDVFAAGNPCRVVRSLLPGNPEITV